MHEIPAALRLRLAPCPVGGSWRESAERLEVFTGNSAGHRDRIAGRVAAGSLFRSGNAPTLGPGIRKTIALCPAVRSFLKSIPGPLYAVRMIEVKPGSRVLSHHDPDRSFEFGVVRLHFVLAASKDAAAWVENERIPLSPGQAWWLDVSRKHEVRCPGESSYAAIVIDVGVTQPLLALFPRAYRGRIRRLARWDHPVRLFRAEAWHGVFGIPSVSLLPAFVRKGRKYRRVRIESCGRGSQLRLGRRSIPLVSDGEGRVRLAEHGPGLSLRLVGGSLRLERLGVIRQTETSRQMITVSAYLPRVKG